MRFHAPSDSDSTNTKGKKALRKLRTQKKQTQKQAEDEEKKDYFKQIFNQNIEAFVQTNTKNKAITSNKASQNFIKEANNFISGYFEKNGTKVASEIINIYPSKTINNKDTFHEQNFKNNISKIIKKYKTTQELKLINGYEIDWPVFLLQNQGHRIQDDIAFLIFGVQNHKHMNAHLRDALSAIPTSLLPLSLFNTIKYLISESNDRVINQHDECSGLIPNELSKESQNTLEGQSSDIEPSIQDLLFTDYEGNPNIISYYNTLLDNTYNGQELN